MRLCHHLSFFFFVLTDRQVFLDPQSSKSRLIAHLLGIISVSEQLCQNNDTRALILQRRWGTQMLRSPTFFFVFPLKIRRTLKLFKLNIRFPAESCCYSECCVEHIGLTLRRGFWFQSFLTRVTSTQCLESTQLCYRWGKSLPSATLEPVSKKEQRFCWPHLDIWKSMTRTSDVLSYTDALVC